MMPSQQPAMQSTMTRRVSPMQSKTAARQEQIQLIIISHELVSGSIRSLTHPITIETGGIGKGSSLIGYLRNGMTSCKQIYSKHNSPYNDRHNKLTYVYNAVISGWWFRLWKSIWHWGGKLGDWGHTLQETGAASLSTRFKICASPLRDWGG